MLCIEKDLRIEIDTVLVDPHDDQMDVVSHSHVKGLLL